MDLQRANVTVASRVMLPANVLFFAVLGANYLLTPNSLLIETPTLRYADGVMQIHAWGVMFVGIAVLMAVALLVHRRVVYQFALWMAMVSMFIWMVVTVASFFLGDASPGAWIWPWYVATACYASSKSLRFWEK